MNKHAIMHQPLSNYAFGLDETHVVFRLKAAKNDLKEVILCYGDTAFRGNPVEMAHVKMVLIHQDSLFDYYEVIIETSISRIVYYFELYDGKTRSYFYSQFHYDHVSDQRNDLFKLPFNRKEDWIEIPKWLNDAVIYNIFPDSFATKKDLITKTSKTMTINGNIVKSKLGGTINGIRENLDYIIDLGCNTIYMNPIFTAGEYHKYDLIDYYSIDPTFGTNDDFKRLVDEAHDKGLKVIIDGVFNHCGWYFHAFDDVVKHQEKSRYTDWFYRLDFPVYRPNTFEEIPPYACFGYERLMPKLNTSNEEVIQYFMDVCSYWMKHYNIDGWRLDVADEVDASFWRRFKETAKAINPEIAIIGEVWQSAEYYLDGTMFDSVMNYDLLKHSKAFFAKKALDAEQFNDRVVHMLTRYKTPFNYAQMNLLDSHDVPRFLSHCDEDINRYFLALIFQFTFIGAPMIFYGNEQGLTGIKEEDYRKGMVFNRDGLIRDFFKRLIELRKNHPVLTKGSFKTLHAGKGDGLYIYERYDEKSSIITILNRSDSLKVINKDYFNDEWLMHHNIENNYFIGAMGYLVIKKSKH
jgi:cyclomaltodextrinase / maltogenic alpha-amylase / neopullulanase